MRIDHRRIGSVAAAITLVALSMAVSAPAHAAPTCAYAPNGERTCEDPFHQAKSDNCDNHPWNTCPYCKDMGKTFPQPPQPVLPCDHSRYE
ncbi:hypothetical protein [Mycobacterium triplex]|uniref:hypothetical protein n=1 Tax=Mycobacterium triplex TaxID=47839 RepID=UPI00111C83A2|nr:hypothetical protein [Mycobacterium triplex]